MSKLIPLICERCGGQIDRATYTCASCGTQYELDRSGDLVVFHCDRRTRALGGRLLIGFEDLEYCDPSVVLESAVKRLTSQLAEKILPFMEIESEIDKKTNALSLTGRCRIVEPATNVYDVLQAEADRRTLNGKILKPRKETGNE